MRVAVRTLLKRVRDALDTQEDEWLEDETLLRWLNAAVPRFEQMLWREQWVTEYELESFDMASGLWTNDGIELSENVSAIVGVYHVIDADNIVRLSPTTLEDRPVSFVPADATHFLVALGRERRDPRIFLRPSPTSGTYYVLYIKEPAHLVLQNGAASAASINVVLDASEGTFTRDDGINWKDEGFLEGQLVTISGFVAPGNNGTFEIVHLDDDVLYVIDPGLSDETSASVDVALLNTEAQKAYVDYPNGWEEWLVLEVARQGAGREDAVNTMVETRKREVQDDVRMMASDRMFAQGPRVRDVRGMESLDQVCTSDLSNYANWTFINR